MERGSQQNNPRHGAGAVASRKLLCAGLNSFNLGASKAPAIKIIGKSEAEPQAAASGAANEGPEPTDKVARLYLLGPLRMLDDRGRDCTPHSGILQGLLAILALSPHGTKMRVTLQDMLWGGSDQKRGRQSLRAALSRLRRALATFQVDLLDADTRTVRLDVGRLWIDVFAYVEQSAALRRTYGAELPDLLEGLDVRCDGDEEFEDWLRRERMRWGERLEALLEEEQAEDDKRERRDDLKAIGSTTGARRASRASVSPGLGVGLLPTMLCTQSDQAALLGESFLDGVATMMRDFLLAEVYDYRDAIGRMPPLSPGPGPAVLLRVKVFERQDRLMLTLQAYGAGEQKLLWTWNVEIPKDGAGPLQVLAFVSEAVERACDTVFRVCGEPSMSGTPYHALNTMYRLDRASLTASRVMLGRAHDATGDSVHLGLLAYLNSLMVGEYWEKHDSSVRAQTRDLVDAVLADNPSNVLTLATTGHACSFVLQDYALALDLLERSTRVDGSPAICWNFLALTYLYIGRVDDASRAMEIAIQRGGFSPFRFKYDATMCMISTVRGDYATAVTFGERALARRPKFAAAMRYMTVSLGYLGEHEAAGRLVSRLRSLAPDFCSDWVNGARLRVVDQQTRDCLMLGLQKAGA